MDKAQVVSYLVWVLFYGSLAWYGLFIVRKNVEEGKRIWRTIQIAAEYIDEPNDPAVITADMLIERITRKEFDENVIVELGQRLGELADKMKAITPDES